MEHSQVARHQVLVLAFGRFESSCSSVYLHSFFQFHMAQKTYNKRLRRRNGKSTQTGIGGFYSSFHYRPTLIQNLNNLKMQKVFTSTCTNKRKKLNSLKSSSKLNFVQFSYASVSSFKQNFLFVRYRPPSQKNRSR